MFAASRIAAPLLAGNAVVLKPSEQTSLSALRLGELALDIFPPGVLNIVSGTGDSVGDPLVAHPDVRRIAFTGSEAIGRRIMRRAGESGIKTVTLELGGKNPMIVFADADLHAAVSGAVAGMNSAGRDSHADRPHACSCTAVSIRALSGSWRRAMQSLSVGDPTDESTDVGPVVSLTQYSRIREFIVAGISDPALDLVTGGEELDGPGYFIPPTLFSAPAGASGPLFTEEIFGPVLVVTPFDDYDEAIRHANALPLGLTASVWTTSLHTALAAARDIRTGYLWVNWSSEHIPGSSFGGVKNSASGAKRAWRRSRAIPSRRMCT